MGDKAKYFGLIFGLTFATLVMTQQPSIFVGLMSRTFSFINDIALPDIWVMDKKVQYVDDIKPLQDTELYRVKGVPGVEWAVPLYRGMLKARLANGNFQSVTVVGIDDSTLVGAPAEMIEGKVEDLRRSDGVIVDFEGAVGRLAKTNPDGSRTPLAVGDSLELNDKRAIVVGIAKTTRSFQSQPMIITTYSRATSYAPRERKLLSFILVKAESGQDIEDLSKKIEERTGLAAYPKADFKELTVRFFLKYTGIPINFGIAVLLGFIIGTAIAGQTFYNFTYDNLKQFAALKAMGTSNITLLKMILLQAFTVGAIGYGLGVGLAAWFGQSMKGTVLAFRMTWHLLLFSGTAVAIIVTIAALISIWKVIKLEPAVVFK